METDEVIVTELRRKGKVVGEAHAWVLPDRDEVCVIVCWKNGHMSSYIESLKEDTDG